MFKKTIILAAIVMLIISLSSCAKVKDFASDIKDKVSNGGFNTKTLSVETDSGKYEVKAEVANNASERQKGYMFQEKIEDGTGMWFVFDDEGVRKFWMKNMKLPLDILFVNKDMEIVSIKDNAQPCKQDPCEMIESPADVQYVLEVPANFVEAKGVEVGDLISE